MSSRLDRVTDLEQRGARSGYSVQRLAKDLGVSERELRWYFQRKLGTSPKHWLDVLRVRKVLESLRHGVSLKTASALSHFKQPSHCSSFVKRVTGMPPTKQRKCQDW